VRDNFTHRTALILAQRVGFLCSRCKVSTVGAAMGQSRVVNIGVAAHITAAAPLGPRFNANIGSDERSRPSNGIWLCQTCAKLVDSDPDRFTVAVLGELKKQAEHEAYQRLDPFSQRNRTDELRQIAATLALLSDPARALSPRIGSVLEITHLPTANVRQRRDAVGEMVQWGRVLDGLYAPRPALIDEVLRAFLEWTTTIQQTISSRRLPVFWIDGRSGDGKSVLLFQLAAALLAVHDGAAMYQAALPDTLPEVIYHAQNNVEDGGLILVVVEDFHRISEQDSFRAAMRILLDRTTLRVAVIACGPSPEKNRFLHLNSFVDAHSWTMPRLTENDFELFGEWFETQLVKPQSLDRTILVEVLFAAQVGRPISVFADHFGRRLAGFGVFETTRRIVALNAIEFAAPDVIFAEGERDSVERLARNDQLHFEWHRASWGEGVRLVHGQIAWCLFQQWSTDPLRNVPIIKTFARTIGAVLSLPGFGDPMARHLMSAARWKVTSILEPETDVGRDAAAEFFEELVDSTEDHLVARCIAIRSALTYFIVERAGVASGFSRTLVSAIGLPGDEGAPPEFRAVVAAQLAVLAKQNRIPDQAYQERAEVLVLSRNVGRYAADALQLLLRFGVSTTELLESWLTSFPEVVIPTDLLTAALKRSGATPRLRRTLMLWIEANWDSDDLPEVLSCLLATAKDEEAQSVATRWLSTHGESDGAADILAVLVNVESRGGTSCTAAEVWVRAHTDSARAINVLSALLKHAYPSDSLRSLGLLVLTAQEHLLSGGSLLPPLLNAYGGSPDIEQAAFEWIRAHWKAPHCAAAISSLLNATKGAESTRALALDWIEAHPTEPASCTLLSALLRVGRNDTVIRSFAIKWLNGSANTPGVYNPIATLLAFNGDDGGVRDFAVNWVEAHGEWHGAHDVLSALLNAPRPDARVITLARSWVDGHIGHTGVSHLMSTILKIGGSDDQLKRTVVAWLDRHRETIAACQLLCSLVKAASDDPQVHVLARAWIDGNAHRPAEQHQLLAAVIRAYPWDTAAIDQALGLLGAMESNQHPYYLLSALAPRVPSHPLIVEMLPQFVADGRQSPSAREESLGEWLAADSSTFPAVHAILTLLRERDPESSAGKQLFGVLARCCARNYGLLFIASRSLAASSTDLCYLVSRGIPMIALDIEPLIAMHREWPPDGEHYIWKAILQSRCRSDLFIDLLNQWLAAHWRRRGYGEVVSGLLKRAMFDPGMVPNLPSRVCEDIEKMRTHTV
jgi:hypothetical protein